MPEVNFTVELPDGSSRDCYSPSSIVKSYFAKGDKVSAAEFARQSRSALTEASQRVKAKFGFECTAASASIQEIESWVSELHPEDTVVVTSI